MLQANTTYIYKHPDLDNFGLNQVKIKLYTQEAHFSVKHGDDQLLYYQIVRFDYPISLDAFLYYLHKWIALEGVKFSSLWLIDFQSRFIVLPSGIDHPVNTSAYALPQIIFEPTKDVKISIPDYNSLWQSTKEKFEIKTSHFLEQVLPFCTSKNDFNKHRIYLEVMPDSCCFFHFNLGNLKSIVSQPQCSVPDMVYFLLQYCNLNEVNLVELDLNIGGIVHPNGPIEETLKGFFYSTTILVDGEMNEFELLDTVFIQSV